jgi:hypothetical protein
VAAIIVVTVVMPVVMPATTAATMSAAATTATIVMPTTAVIMTAGMGLRQNDTSQGPVKRCCGCQHQTSRSQCNDS